MKEAAYQLAAIIAALTVLAGGLMTLESAAVRSNGAYAMDMQRMAGLSAPYRHEEPAAPGVAPPVLTHTGAKDGAPYIGATDMNIMQAYHELTQIAVRLHGGRPSDYNTPATWQCAGAAVRMQADIESLMRAHKECGRLRVAIAAARMVYAMRSAAVR